MLTCAAAAMVKVLLQCSPHENHSRHILLMVVLPRKKEAMQRSSGIGSSYYAGRESLGESPGSSWL